MMKSRKMRWAWQVACMRNRNSYRISLAKPEESRQLGRPRHRLDDTDKMYVKEIGLGWYGLSPYG
jgi:hypothetical protein